MSEQPAPDSDRSSRDRVALLATVLFFWLAVAGLLLAIFWETDPILLGHNDDHARIAQVADLQKGQGWYDLTQYRLNPPAGTSMQWTRHVDVLLAGLIETFGGPGASAQRAAVITLPMVLLLLLFVSVAMIARRLGGSEVVPMALVLLMASLFALVQFAPGRVDHHGLQIVLLLIAVAGLLRVEQRVWSRVAGLAAGVSLSMGLELLPAIVAIVLSVGFVAVTGAQATLRAVVGFSGTLVGGGIVSALVFAPPSRLISRDCDVLSLPYLVAIVLAAAVLSVTGLVGRSGREGRRARLVFLVSAGALAGAAALAVAPGCAAGPYANVDPLLRQYWLSNMLETRSLVTLLSQQPALAVGIIVPGVAATGLCAVGALRDRRLDGLWARLLPVLLLGYVTAFIQMRGAAAVTALSAAVLGVWVMRVSHRLAGRALGLRVAVLAGLIAGVSGLGPMQAVATFDEIRMGSSQCVVEAESLRQLPPQLIAAPIDLGPAILAFTDHSVLASPYHRNEDGNLAALAVFTARPDDAADLLRSMRATLVVVCDGLLETTLLVEMAPSGLVAALTEGNPPSGFSEIDLGTSTLRVFVPPAQGASS